MLVSNCFFEAAPALASTSPANVPAAVVQCVRFRVFAMAAWLLNFGAVEATWLLGFDAANVAACVAVAYYCQTYPRCIASRDREECDSVKVAGDSVELTLRCGCVPKLNN